VLRLVGHDDARVVAVSRVLRPQAWRSFTPERLVRHALGALDHYRVMELLDTVPGVRTEDVSAATPTEPDDERMPTLVDFLAACRWRSFTVVGVSRHLVSVLDTRWREREWLDLEAHWLRDSDRDR
jgi:hypothetical protein